MSSPSTIASSTGKVIEKLLKYICKGSSREIPVVIMSSENVLARITGTHVGALADLPDGYDSSSAMQHGHLGQFTTRVDSGGHSIVDRRKWRVELTILFCLVPILVTGSLP
nr:hypothetical protein Iba_chr07dCG11260 [Ipomoea batatas]